MTKGMDIYGTTILCGVTYTLTNQPDFTNRLLPGGYTNFHEASSGENYDVEFSAPAVDPAGKRVTVYWMFELIKGDEPELDDLNWEDADRILREE